MEFNWPSAMDMSGKYESAKPIDLDKAMDDTEHTSIENLEYVRKYVRENFEVELTDSQLWLVYWIITLSVESADKSSSGRTTKGGK